MRAAIFQGVGKPLVVDDIPVSKPEGPKDVVVKVGRCGICGSDFHTTLDVLEAGDTRPHSMITDTIKIDETPKAFEALKQRTTQCKVLIDSGKS